MPAPPVPAATVMLLRSGTVSPEVLMLERHADSEVMPATYVFPGGRVEEQDHALIERLEGAAVDEIREVLPDLDPELAPPFFVAAIRETFEESGILLARRRGRRELLAPDDVEPLHRHRLAMQRGETSFRTLIEHENLELATEGLSVHAHWITPELLPRRFDTLFFAAVAPPGQRACHDGVEASDHVWIRPEEALDQMRRGTRQIIFPTACNLETLAGFGCVDEALEASRQRPVMPILPVVVKHDGVSKLVIPEEAGYSTREDPVDNVHRKPPLPT